MVQGREDLRMDERLMQFLHVANLLQSDAGPAAASPGLRARVFSVTALGHKTGLLQWVDGTAPMYEAYRSWQRHLTRYGGCSLRPAFSSTYFATYSTYKNPVHRLHEAEGRITCQASPAEPAA